MESFNVPEGYKLVPMVPQKRGRKSILETKHLSELSQIQLKQMKWRQNNRERLREYNKKYYHAKRKNSLKDSQYIT